MAPLQAISPRVLHHTDKIHALLRIPPVLAQGLDAAAVVTELTRRLREVLDLDEAIVEVDYGDGRGSREIAHDGHHPDGDQAPARSLDIPLPLSAPLRGRLRLYGPADQLVAELAELAALRIALSIESDYLHKADRRRRDWMAYLADTSQLLGQSLDVGLTITVVPQILVPRLGQWCAVHLVGGEHGLELAALTHANEELIPELRSALTLSAGGEPTRTLRARLRELATEALPPTWVSGPTDAIALSLHAARRAIGVLTIGRPVDRSHSPEDVALISDIAQRAALAIDNAQRATQHIETSQALSVPPGTAHRTWRRVRRRVLTSQHRQRRRRRLLRRTEPAYRPLARRHRRCLRQGRPSGRPSRPSPRHAPGPGPRRAPVGSRARAAQRPHD